MEQRRKKPWLPLLLVVLLSVAFSGAHAPAPAPADASNGEGKCQVPSRFFLHLQIPPEFRASKLPSAATSARFLTSLPECVCAQELTRRRAAPAGAAETATGATATATTAKAAATATGGTLGGRRPPPTLGSSLPGRRLPAQGRRRGRGSRRPPASCSLQPPCWMAGSDLVYSEV